MPLDIEGKAFLVDPAVEPSSAVRSIEVSRGEVELKSRIILAKEQILAGVVEVCIGDLAPVNHRRHVFIVCVIEVSARVREVTAFLDCVLDHSDQRAAGLGKARDEVLRS